MSEIKRILEGLEVATTHFNRDRVLVIDAHKAISDLQDKLATIRDALVTVVYGDADIHKCEEAIDIIDIING
jgi:hypothetical protein